MIVGVTEGYRKSLEINGTGYRVTAKGNDLEFALGFSHPVVVQPPAGISFTVERPTIFTWPASTSSWWVRSPRTSARSARRSLQGQGCEVPGEVIRRKAGKAGKK